MGLMDILFNNTKMIKNLNDYDSNSIIKSKHLLVVFILLVGILIRFYKISALSIWTDEGISVKLAKSSLANIVAYSAADVHPPLYYIILKYWIFIFGSNEVAVRSLSAIFGSISLFLIYAISRYIFNSRVAILATVISAVSPFLVWYSQETRAYSLLLMLTLALTYVFIKYLKSGWSLMIPYFVVAVAAIYTHYYAIWIILAHNAYILFNWRSSIKKFRAWIPTQLLIGISFLPWLFIALKQFGQGQEGRDFSIFSVPKAYILLTLGRSIDLLRLGKVINAEYGNKVVDGAVIALVVLVIGYLIIRALFSVMRSQNKIEIFPAIYLFLPLLLICVLSFIKPVFDSKSLIVVFPALAMLVSHGILLHAHKSNIVLISLILMLFGYSLTNYYFNPIPWKEDFRGVANYLKSNVRQGETVLLQPGYLNSAFTYYYGQSSFVKGSFELNPTQDLVAKEMQNISVNSKGVWLVMSAHPDADPKGYIKSSLGDKLVTVEDKDFSGFHLTYYQKQGVAR